MCGSEGPQRAGILVFLALVLTASLFAAPALTTHQDFGHRHPENSPFHFHAIAGILSGDVSVPVVDAAVIFVPLFRLPLLGAVEYREKMLFPSRAIRAPPALYEKSEARWTKQADSRQATV